ncbi:phosphotransferase family protein [Nocardia sp. CDC160]|uniref:phosphotransferase family protein n=1 Tax=Nocardia sp. CDC160 TaxID=3112166 RepID=UPI002DBF2073|nr:phosphotransferase family protein [Nocardia sp. CDC160]MEC3915633.1 phosphotransferase family protein [Nocardia sp. CDC160]
MAGNDARGRTIDAETELAAALTTMVGRALPAPITIEGMRRLSGGASRETWSFDALDATGARHPLILRRDFTDGRTQSPDLIIGRKDALDRAGEYTLLRTLHAAGLPVPRPIAAPESGDALADCYLMERVDGETRPWVIIRAHEFDSVRPQLVRQLAATLARVHSFTATDLPFMPQRTLDDQLELIRRLLDHSGITRPALEAALRWCHDRLGAVAPANRPLRLVHGDFRTSNYAAGPEGLRAVFDWEFSHIGDPVTDLGYACMRAWRFGADDREFTGIGSRAEFFAAYEAAGGEPVDPDRVRFSEVLCNLVAAGVFLERTRAYLGGEDRGLEAAAIARRIAELEYDLLHLLD